LKNTKIEGGNEAARNQFPFAVIFFITAVDDEQSVCSGAIISNNYVLSAAHCFGEMYTADLLAGVHNIETEYPAYEITLGPNNVLMHENYDNIRNLNDMALVSVAQRPFTFGVSIQAIPIIPRSMASSNLTSVIGRISGW
jgi:secreted trypsin-like serine protease